MRRKYGDETKNDTNAFVRRKPIQLLYVVDFCTCNVTSTVLGTAKRRPCSPLTPNTVCLATRHETRHIFHKYHTAGPKLGPVANILFTTRRLTRFLNTTYTQWRLQQTGPETKRLHVALPREHHSTSTPQEALQQEKSGGQAIRRTTTNTVSSPSSSMPTMKNHRSLRVCDGRPIPAAIETTQQPVRPDAFDQLEPLRPNDDRSSSSSSPRPIWIRSAGHCRWRQLRLQPSTTPAPPKPPTMMIAKSSQGVWQTGTNRPESHWDQRISRERRV